MGPGRAPFTCGRCARYPLFWTPYADWIFTVVSTAGILVMAWLVLRPRA